MTTATSTEKMWQTHSLNQNHAPLSITFSLNVKYSRPRSQLARITNDVIVIQVKYAQPITFSFHQLLTPQVLTWLAQSTEACDGD